MVRRIATGLGLVGLVLVGAGCSVSSGRQFDTTHARDVRRGQGRAEIQAWFGEPYQTSALDGANGCQERWTYQYATQGSAAGGLVGGGRHSQALVVDFDAAGQVCDTAYVEQ